jgi:non-ribosomal peptide synthetase component F/acyl carrier protein
MLSQGILSNLVWWQRQKTGIDSSLRCLQFTSINFCVSFQEIFITLAAGGQVHLIGDIERQDIDFLMDFLVARRVELLYLPFSYLNFLFNESSRWQAGYKTYLKHIITAGEQLKITAGLKQFLESNPGIRLHNHYGSSEMHVVTSYTLDAATVSLTPVPPAGKPIANTSIYILDESNNPVPAGVWGELCIAGSWEVLGYIHNPRLTDEKLFTHPVFSGENDNKRLYRSGDIGRWLEDGNIELKGRKDFQVKIRGFRVEPAEIESKILAISEVTDCVVVVREDSGSLAVEAKTTVQYYLAAYVVVEGIDAAGIKRIIGNELPQYMVPKIVILERLPLMPNGKVDREQLPDPGFPGDDLEGYAAPENDIQGELAAIWSELLGIDAQRIGIDDNFFERGGHSLKATTMMSKIHKELNVKVNLLEIFKTPTIRDLARLIEELTEDVFTPIEPMEQREYYALSSAQKRLYVMWQLAPGSIAYNLTSVVVLNGHLDRGRLESTFRQMIERHESLRTSFQMVQKNPVQKIWAYDQVEFAGEYYHLTGKEEEERVRESDSIIRESFIRPFDLSRAPLLRVGLIKLSGEDTSSSLTGDAPRHILMVDMHHIITDGTSLGIFIQDFIALYSGQELPGLKLQYRDFAEWQTGIHQNKTVNKSIKQQEQYWLNRFEGEVPQLAMPRDFPRPPIQDFKGDIIGFEIDEHWTAEIKKLVVDAEATIYMILLAVYNILLSKYALQDDIVVGSGVAGRQHTDLETIIGMFVNMLPMRNYPGVGKSFNEFLQEVKKNAINAFDNQGYQFEELVDKLDIPRDSSKNPIFDAEFTMQNIELMDMKIELPGLQLEPFKSVGLYKAKFDLVLEAIEGQGKIYMTLTYAAKLFERSTVKKIGQHYREVLQQVLENREILLGDIQLSHKLSAVTEVVNKEKTLFDF